MNGQVRWPDHMEDPLHNLITKIVLPLFFGPMAIAAHLVRNRWSRMFRCTYLRRGASSGGPGMSSVADLLARGDYKKESE